MLKLMSNTPLANHLFLTGNLHEASLIGFIEIKTYKLEKIKLINLLLYIIKIVNKYRK